MKVRNLINLLSVHNLDADIIFKIDKKFAGVSVSSMSNCKCKEKEIFLTIGKKGD